MRRRGEVEGEHLCLVAQAGAFPAVLVVVAGHR